MRARSLPFLLHLAGVPVSDWGVGGREGSSRELKEGRNDEAASHLRWPCPVDVLLSCLALKSDIATNFRRFWIGPKSALR